MTTDYPNIVLIMTDNQPADAIGCYGNEEIYTPNLDDLGKEGVRFDNAYCSNAMCSPSRASVWTGRMPCQHGLHTWLDDRLMEQWPPDWNAIDEFKTLPEILKENGYATAMIGKYHLGRLEKPQNGIDHWITMSRGHTLDFYGNQMRVNDRMSIYDGHSVDFFTKKAVEYIGDRASSPDHPFLLMLPYNGPYGHWPSNAFRIAYNIPLLIWGAGLSGGRSSSSFVSSIDLYATLLDHLGLWENLQKDDVPSRSFNRLLDGGDDGWTDEVFIEQEETRAIRTPSWSYFKRFNGSGTYPLENELYDLSSDPDERNNLSGQAAYENQEKELSLKIDAFFQTYANPKFDLWNGGSVKSNTSRPWLWKDAWGDGWQPVF